MCLAQHDVPWTFRKRWQRKIDVISWYIYINMFILYMNTYIPCFSPSISKCMNVTWIDLDPSSWSEFFEDPVEDL